MSKTKLLAIAIGLLAANSASAMKGTELARLADAFQRANGNDAASQKDILDMGIFAGYIRGVEDSMQGYRFCVPAEASFNKRVELITKYMKEHPEDLHNGAIVIVVQALAPAYPCKTGTPSP